jgi:PPOX class probable F420-dependent enzyme
MELAQALDFIRPRRDGVLATYRSNGRAHLSNITYGIDGGGRIRISVTDGRAKTNNLRRDPRAELHVTTAEFYPWVALECDVELLPVCQDPHDEVADALVEYYRSVRGEHPDWDEYRQVMADEHRLLIALTPTRAYGLLG